MTAQDVIIVVIIDDDVLRNEKQATKKNKYNLCTISIFNLKYNYLFQLIRLEGGKSKSS